MAREHANIRNDIWNDDEFRDLSAQAQLLYLQLLTSATLSYAGVADWRPKRLAALSRGRTVDEVEGAAEELIAGLYIVIDDETEEVLLRSFLKHDGLLQKPNVSKAMVTAHGQVYSMTLKGVIVHELKRLVERFPEWRGFTVPEVRELLLKGSVNPSELSRNPSGNPSEKKASLLTTNYLLPTTELLATSSAFSTQDLERFFEKAYSRWPKKVERKKSLEKFILAAKKRDAVELASDIVRFGDAYRVAVDDVQFVPALNVWLNGERWTDELPHRRSHQPAQSKSDEAQDFIQRLEAIDATRGGGETVSGHQELR